MDDARYADVLGRLSAALEGEADWVSAMATVACELHTAMPANSWTGFYRHCTAESALDEKAAKGHRTLLRVGPYQGGHGCVRIALGRGVCGTAAVEGVTQLHEDVTALENHIFCTNSTLSEIVVPVLSPDGALLGVLDLDSDDRAAFSELDRRHLETLCTRLGEQFGTAGTHVPESAAR